MATYLDLLVHRLRGCTDEELLVLPMSPWGVGSPVVIGRGTTTVYYDHKRVAEVMREAHVKGCIVAHGHPTADPVGPSWGDCRDALALKSFLEAFGFSLQDFVIINAPGQVFSFKAKGILDDPMRGLTFAKAAERAAMHH